MLRGAEEIRDMAVREVMTPRVDVVALAVPVELSQVIHAVKSSGHRAYPVYDEDLDQLIGILFITDLLRAGLGEKRELSALDISRRVREPWCIPESMTILDVLAEMSASHHSLAIILDEFGGVAGLVTWKDLLEPVLGSLHDELDQPEEAEIARVDKRRWLIDGGANVDTVREQLGIPIPEGDYVTLGGYLFDAFGRIPSEGDHVELAGWELKVVEMEKRRVVKVLLSSPSEKGDGPSGKPGPTRGPQDQ
jgi:putative hemolysin